MYYDSMVVLIVVVAVILIAVLWLISTGNRFRRLIVKIHESDSGIDVALTKRFDMLTKLLGICKRYAAHETETFAKIIELRRGMSMAERQAADERMAEVTGQMNVLAEAYPELRSSENFQELQRGARDAEEQLQAARRIYNANVSAFNQLLVSFPSNLVGRMQKQIPQEFFEADSRKRDDVDMLS